MDSALAWMELFLMVLHCVI